MSKIIRTHQGTSFNIFREIVVEWFGVRVHKKGIRPMGGEAQSKLSTLGGGVEKVNDYNEVGTSFD